MSRTDETRREALRRALAHDLDAASRRAALHPASLELAVTEERRDALGELLWAELEGLEETHGLGASGGSPRGGPADFFARRHRLERVREVGETASTLPPLWSRIVRLARGPVGRGTVDLGVLVIASVVDRADRQRLVRELEPLGSALTRRVAAAGYLELDPMLEGAWRLEYLDESRALTRADLASRMGRRLLTTLFRQLPEASRRAAVAAARSNIFKKLEEVSALPLPRPADADVAVEMADRVYIDGFGSPAGPIKEDA